jgi:hypothetical protein
MTNFELPDSVTRALARELVAATESAKQARSSAGEADGSLARAEQKKAEVLARVKTHNEERKAARVAEKAVKAGANRTSKKRPKLPRPLVPCPTCGMEVIPSKLGSLPAHMKAGAEAWCHGGSDRKKIWPTGSYSYSSKSRSVRTVSGGAPGLGKRA